MPWQARHDAVLDACQRLRVIGALRKIGIVIHWQVPAILSDLAHDINPQINFSVDVHSTAIQGLRKKIGIVNRRQIPAIPSDLARNINPQIEFLRACHT